MTDWGEWTFPPPLLEPEQPITPATCEIRSRLTHTQNGQWEATAVRYRPAPHAVWQHAGRIAAWARPRGTQPWIYAALTHLSTCNIKPPTPGSYAHSQPRIRTSWVIYTADTIEQCEPEHRTPYWHQQLSDALADFAVSNALAAINPTPCQEPLSG